MSDGSGNPSTASSLPGLRTWLPVIAVACGFVAVALLRIQEPVAQDELNWLFTADAFLNEGHRTTYPIAMFSPHLYVNLVWLCLKLFGPGVAVARIPGVLAWVLTLALVYVVVRRSRQVDAGTAPCQAFVAVLLCASLPAAVQAAAIIDIDNTVLVPATVALCYAFERLLKERSVAWHLTFALLMCLALWCRTTTPLVLMPVFVAVAALSGGVGAAVRVGGWAALGGAAFTGTWLVYCKAFGFDVWGPLAYTGGSLVYRSIGSGGFSVSWFAQSLVYLVLWTGMLTPVLVLWITSSRLRSWWREHRVPPEDIYLLGGLALVVGYTFVGGAVYGFPKHHCPGFPLLCIAAGLAMPKVDGLHGRRLWLPVLGLAAAAAVVQYLVVGDLLRVIRCDLRTAVLEQGAIRPLVVSAAVRAVLGFGMCAGLVGLSGRIRGVRALPLPVGLVAAVLGVNTGLVILQQVRPYYKGYNYGGTGTVETARRLDECVPAAQEIIAPSEVVYYLHRERRYYENQFWDSPERLRVALEDPCTGAFVISPMTHTVAQVRRTMDSSEIARLLRDQFVLERVGSYWVWQRRGS